MNSPFLEKVIQTDSGFWTPARQKMLVAIEPFLDSREIGTEALQQMQDALRSGHKVLARTKIRRLATLLEWLVNYGFLESAVRPTVRMRLPRPCILPPDPKAYRLLETIEVMADALWDTWLAEERSIEEIHFAYVFVLARDMGMAGHFMTQLLAMLRWEDVRPDGSLALRIHPRDDSARRCMLYQTSSARLLLDHIRQRAGRSRPEQYVFAPGVSGETRREKALKKTLAAAYRRFCGSLPLRTDGKTRLNWNEFCKYSPLLALYNGLDQPFLLTALAASSLPTSLPFSANLPLFAGESGLPPALMRHMTKDNRSRYDGGEPWKSEPVPEGNSDSPVEIDDWCGRAKQVLRKFVAGLGQAMERRVSTDAQANRLQASFARARGKADMIATSRSALHLAIDWIEQKFLKERSLTPRSVDDYLRYTFEEGFLADPRASIWRPGNARITSS